MLTPSPERLGNLLSEDIEVRTAALRALAVQLARGDLDGIALLSDLLLATENIGYDWKEALVAGGWSESDAYAFILSFSGVIIIHDGGRIDDASFAGPYTPAKEIAAARATAPNIPTDDELRRIMLDQARAQRAVEELCRDSAEATAAGLAAAVILREVLLHSAQTAVVHHFSRVWVPLAARKELQDERVLRLVLAHLPDAEQFDVEGQRFCCAALLSDIAVRALTHKLASIRIAALYSLGSLLEDNLLLEADREKLLDQIESVARKDGTPKVRRRAVATLLGEHEWFDVPNCISPARRAAFLEEAVASESAPSVRLSLATGLFLLAQTGVSESASALAKLAELATSDAELPAVNRRALELKELHEGAAELEDESVEV